MPAIINLTGKRFGRLVVFERIDGRRWSCRCDCGSTKPILGSSLWFRRGYKTKDIAKAFGIGPGYASKLKRQILRDGEQG